MALAILAVLVGFGVLMWSADRFVDNAAATAKIAGMPPLLIGMLVVGFGTSAPEIVVSVMAALDGNPQLALGNALGSNIVNIGLILGLTAIISPIAVQSNIVRKELPILLLVSVGVGIVVKDSALLRIESLALLAGFVMLIVWSIYAGLKSKDQPLEQDIEQGLANSELKLSKTIVGLAVGLVFLILSSRLLVWGAVAIAQQLGVSDLIIGLTIVAIGTSLPELAASIIAARRGEHDIALGNIVGSNLFNSLAVVGIAGTIAPVANLHTELFARDWLTMTVLTSMLFIMAIGIKHQGRISRGEGIVLISTYIGYNLWLFTS
ncbi:calcium/sodium antiporter [Vibrio sp. SCSIO 43136]|uniref:calcium/sodium antiporter n=1 Tax=Vibrio sp. SCSIO 43136 TaxID=2819101 RepID=UPI002074E0C8|nr:calcium/sodium antiporter [Vibrio sp. SCSIO 43136]USD64038.1 calcium/sodium antiporter [Vibrio sp. SCSIO 43136]